ncbi:hypothetical protein HA039_17935 [Streptomyces liangshanensis]|uniref:Tat (Twin-arginine translocation) pathway signal sequence n=1 Tax=Streptomyces liangshanensis TaxID=2717324 RepID=A0A6G9H943_9ACTN|nr:hypothetical protein HA039_17935 [Streptomyces liangshanensis]
MSGRALASRAAFATTLVAALGVAFVVAPRVLAGLGPGSGFAGQGALVRDFRSAFVAYWGAGDPDLSPRMEGLVDYWVRYHVAKAAIAALLLVVCAALGAALWKAFLRADGPGAWRRAALASAGGGVSLLALFSLAVVMANIQGAIAPFSSLLSLLPVGETHGELATTLDQVRAGLSHGPGTATGTGAGSRTSPVLDLMISDFARYHAVMAVISGVVAAALVGFSTLLWRRFAGTPSSAPRTRRVWAAFAALSTLTALAVIVVAAANTGTATNPAPALLGFFNGGM